MRSASLRINFMKKFIPLCLVTAFISLSSPLLAKDYLADRICSDDKRFSTFQTCFKLLEERNAKILVETGTARNGVKNCAGDGCSTVLFADWAKDHNATLFSVDIDPNAIAESSEAVEHINNMVQFITHDSIAFLRSFGQPIDFLYLDSYDYDFENPKPSQMHHLCEIEAALPFLHKNTIVMIDDCDLPHGGKGKLAISFLKSHGWHVLASGYQTILIYPNQQ